MVPTRRLLRLLAAAVLPLVLLADAPAARAGGDDFEFGQKLAQSRFFKLARRVYEDMLAAPGATDTTKDLARYGLATLGYQEALTASGRPDVPFAEVVKLYTGAADQILAFARKNPTHPKAEDALLLSGQVRLQLVTWCGDLLEREADLASRGTSAGEVAGAARGAVDAAIAHFESLKSSPGRLGELATYHWTTSQYYRALTLDPGSPPQIEALKSAENDLDRYIQDHDGELLAVFAQDMLGMALAERAKHAPAGSVEQEQLVTKALTWFQTCIDQENFDSGTLTVITNGYQHYGKTCLEAGRIGTRNFLRDGVEVLSKMLERVPTAGKVFGGIRALITLGDLEKALGNTDSAVNIYRDASDRASQLELRTLVGEADRRIREAVSGGSTAIGDINVLRKVAESNWAEKRYEEAIRGFQGVIGLAPATSSGFVEYAWPAWERIAACYKELGDPLSASMAYLAIHEAWLDGLIPFKKGDENDANMRRAGSNRKRGLALLAELASRTRSKVFQEAAKRGDQAFVADYPDHPDAKTGVLSGALEKLRAAREAKRNKAAGWRGQFEEARTIFETESRNLKSDNQDPATAQVVRIDVALSDETPEGLKAAERGLAFSKAALEFWQSEPAKQKLVDYPALTGKRTEAVQDVRMQRGQLLKEVGRWDEVLAEMGKLREELGEGERGDDAQALVVEAHVRKGDIQAADKALVPLLKRGKHPSIPALVSQIANFFDEKFRAGTKLFNAKNEELNGTKEDRGAGVAAKLRAATARYNDLLSQKVTQEQQAAEHRRQIEAWKKDPSLVKGLNAKIVEELEKKTLPTLDGAIAKLTGELGALDATMKDLTTRSEALARDIQEIVAAQYEPLTEAVKRYDVGLQSQMDAGSPVKPEEISRVAARWAAAARNPKGTAADWEKTQLRYEQLLAHPDVKALPESDATKRGAYTKLGRAYSYFSAAETDPIKRAELVRKAIMMLEQSLAARPENTELMLGLLAGRYGTVIWENPLERGTTYRFVVPKSADAAGLRAAIAKLGAPDSPIPLPRMADEAKQVVFRRALAAWKDAMAKVDPASFDLLFKDVQRSGLDAATYRELGNIDREFRASLAAAYAESGEDADLGKGDILIATLLRGPISVDEYSEEYWEASTLALRHWTNHAERLSAAGGVPARASELRKKAGQWVRGYTSKSAVPIEGGVRDAWTKLIERLTRGLRAEGAPEINEPLAGAAKPPPVAPEPASPPAAGGGPK